MKLRVVIILIVSAMIAGAGYVAYRVHHFAYTSVPNSYAVWWVGDLVVGHLQQHDDEWPQSWNDLRPIYDQQIAELGQTWTFDELKRRVVVRWDVDVEATRRLPEPPSDLIFLRDGGTEHWAGQEPNEKVFRYLKQTSTPAPNQALQRTGSARGYTLLSRLQPVVGLAGR